MVTHTNLTEIQSFIHHLSLRVFRCPEERRRTAVAIGHKYAALKYSAFRLTAHSMAWHYHDRQVYTVSRVEVQYSSSEQGTFTTPGLASPFHFPPRDPRHLQMSTTLHNTSQVVHGVQYPAMISGKTGKRNLPFLSDFPSPDCAGKVHHQVC